MVDPRRLRCLDPNIKDPGSSRPEFKEQFWPKRGDYKDHIRWILEKNPTMSLQEAEAWAKRQIEFQIGIILTDLHCAQLEVKGHEQFLQKLRKEINA